GSIEAIGTKFVMDPRVLFVEALRSQFVLGEWEDPAAKRFGLKVEGLLRLPPAWTIGDFAVVPPEICAQLSNGSSEALAQDIQSLFDRLGGHGHRLIVRSSAADETIRSRGRYTSEICEPDPASLLKAMRHVLAFPATIGGKERVSPAFSLLIHEYITC